MQFPILHHREKTMTTQQTESRQQVQLPPYFQPHPENAVVLLTIDQASMMVKQNIMPFDTACYLFPPRLWQLLPQPTPDQPKRKGWQALGLRLAKQIIERVEQGL
jgi:hypothetical protein